MKKTVRPYIKWCLGINPFRKYEITDDSLTVKTLFSGSKKISLPPTGECDVEQNLVMKILDSGNVTVKGSGGSIVKCTNVGCVKSFISALYNKQESEANGVDISWFKDITQDDLGEHVIVVPRVPSTFEHINYARGGVHSSFSLRNLPHKTSVYRLIDLGESFNAGHRLVLNAAVKGQFLGGVNNYSLMDDKDEFSKDIRDRFMDECGLEPFIDAHRMSSETEMFYLPLKNHPTRFRAVDFWADSKFLKDVEKYINGRKLPSYFRGWSVEAVEDFRDGLKVDYEKFTTELLCTVHVSQMPFLHDDTQLYNLDGSSDGIIVPERAKGIKPLVDSRKLDL